MIVPSLPRLKMLVLKAQSSNLSNEDALLLSSGLAYYARNIENLTKADAREVMKIEELSCRNPRSRRGW